VKKWFIYTTLGTVLGALLGYFLLWLWFFFRLVFLGYGDSGPSWIIVVNNWILIVGFSIGIAGGQLLFFIDVKIARRGK